MTILEEVSPLSQSLYDYIHTMCLNKHNQSFCDMSDDFNLYVSIAKDADKALPISSLSNIIFKPYRIKKKQFPTKSYYTL